MSPTTLGKPPKKPSRLPPLPAWLGRWLCRAGLHDDHVVDASFGFAPGETVERIECARCGRVAARRGRR